MAFISHLKITHAAEPWLNWVPNKKQYRKGKGAGSKYCAALRTAKTLWETPGSVHMKRPSAGRGQTMWMSVTGRANVITVMIYSGLKQKPNWMCDKVYVLGCH